MSSPQGITFDFPYFQPPPPAVTHPPPAPSHHFQLPPPHVFPPPPPHVLPPPTPMPHPLTPPPHPYPFVPPYPQPHPFPPPVHPQPHPFPPPAPDHHHHHHTIIIIVVVSCGGLFFCAFLAAALFCFLKKRKKKTHRETEIISFDKHRKLKEEIVKGPHGTEAVVLTVEDDVHIEEEIKKSETVSKDSHIKELDDISAGAETKTHHDTEIISFDEHQKVKEEIVKGPHGTEAIVLTVEDDVHNEEEIKKSEKVGKDSRIKELDDISAGAESSGPSGATPEDSGGVPAGSGEHHHQHHLLREHKSLIDE